MYRPAIVCILNFVIYIVCTPIGCQQVQCKQRTLFWIALVCNYSEQFQMKCYFNVKTTVLEKYEKYEKW